MIKIRKTYNSCSELPLYNFIKIVVTDDKNWLYSEPKRLWHKSAGLDSIWENIFNEYSELSQDKQGQAVLGMIKYLQYLNGKLFIIENAIKLLYYANPIELYKPTIDILRNYGFPFSYSKETIIQDLNKTVSFAKRIVLERNEALSEWEKTQSNESQKANEMDYDLLIGELEKFQGHSIDPFQTNVTKFISYINRFNSANGNKNG